MDTPCRQIGLPLGNNEAWPYPSEGDITQAAYSQMRHHWTAKFSPEQCAQGPEERSDDLRSRSEPTDMFTFVWPNRYQISRSKQAVWLSWLLVPSHDIPRYMHALQDYRRSILKTLRVFTQKGKSHLTVSQVITNYNPYPITSTPVQPLNIWNHLIHIVYKYSFYL